MTSTNRTPLRVSLLTFIVWLAVAAGIIFLLWQVITRISANKLPVSTAAPNLTQVYETIAVNITAQKTSSVAPTAMGNTPSPTTLPTTSSTQAAPTPLQSQNKTSSPVSVNQTSTPQVLCDRAGAGNPIDVSIPDDSLISPGQGFIKTWKLVNTGSCTWTTAYSASFFYGDRMDSPESVALLETVLPAQSVELSIEMVAPLVPGTYQGNWKLMNPTGALFGIGPNGDSPFWVRIIVPANPASTATVTPGVTPTFSTTGSPSATAAATPPVQASGEISSVPGDSIDLDTLTLNSGDEDLAYQVDSNNYHWLAPQIGAMIGVYSRLEPSLEDCQSAGMSTAPIAVESLSVGTYLCYLTNEGRYGKAFFTSLDGDSYTLTMDLLTWANP
jgi:Ig-like domain from next to BRCA1 gene